MKEKRYYCDWALSQPNEKSNRLMSKVLLISLVVVTAISSLIYYNIMMYNHGEDLEAYSESAIPSNEILFPLYNVSAAFRQVPRNALGFNMDKYEKTRQKFSPYSFIRTLSDNKRLAVRNSEFVIP